VTVGMIVDVLSNIVVLRSTVAVSVTASLWVSVVAFCVGSGDGDATSSSVGDGGIVVLSGVVCSSEGLLLASVTPAVGVVVGLT
jgi:hypothetical protein